LSLTGHSFKCVGNLCHRDRRHDLYRRCGPEQRLYRLKIGKNAPPLLSCLAELVCEPYGDALEHDIDRCAQQNDGVEAVVEPALIGGASGDEE
jgi:hypothetical protein